MDQNRQSSSVSVIQESSSAWLITPTLGDQCLSQWMVAADQVFVACMKTPKQAQCGQSVELATNAAIAASASKDQIPHSIHARAEVGLFELVGKEMIDVGGGALVGERDGARAVKAPALLVAIQSVSAVGDRPSFARSVGEK